MIQPPELGRLAVDRRIRPRASTYPQGPKRWFPIGGGLFDFGISRSIAPSYAASMRIKIALLLLTITCGCGGSNVASQKQNAEPSRPAGHAAGILSPRVADAVAAWTKCRTSKLMPLAQTTLTEEAAVNQTFEECASYETAVVSAWDQDNGPGSGYQVEELKARARTTALGIIRRLRGAPPLASDDSSARWGRCVGENLPQSVPFAASADSIVDSAMQVCSAEMARYRAKFAQQFGEADTAIHIEQVRQRMRQLAIEMIEQRRSPK